MALSSADEFWQKFITETGTDSDSKCAGDLTFESAGFTNDAQIANILSGRRTAIFSTFVSYSVDCEPLPVSGELYLVFDRGNNPRAVIEIESVNILPFSEITWGMARKEGEDENLEQWKIRWQENLEEEGEIVGFKFSPEIKIIFQTFRVLYK